MFAADNEICKTTHKQGDILSPEQIAINNMAKITANGINLKLANIYIPLSDELLVEKVKLSAIKWLSGRTIRMKIISSYVDKHERCTARLLDSKREYQGVAASLSAYLTAQGLAFAVPSYAGKKQYAYKTLLAIEKKSRTKNIGFWQNKSHQINSNKTPNHLGEFAIVEGVVKNIAKIKGHIFINFGDDWKSDFTGFIPKNNNFTKDELAGITSKGLVGKKIKLRGLIYEKNGASITIRHPYQLELPNI